MKITKELIEEIRLLCIPIEKFDFGERAYNALKRAGVNTALDLLELFPDDIKGIRNLGPKSIRVIIRELERKGYDLEALKDD